MVAVKDSFRRFTPEEYFVWEEQQIDLYRKNDAGEWIFTQYRTGDIIELRSIDLSFPIEQVYRGIIFE